VTGQLRILRRELARLLERLGNTPHVPGPRKCRHKLTILLLYGLLMFVFKRLSGKKGSKRKRPKMRLFFRSFEANSRPI
jgi:hypothetical protein